MYAIIKTGSKQYSVEKGDTIDVELLKHDTIDVELLDDGVIKFKNVLLVSGMENVKMGTPYLAGTVVQAKLVKQDAKGPKVVAFKYKRRKPIRRKVGHRQRYTRVKITDILD
ncbi:MAG: 50S ribosomal protein L21 [Chlamydiae bacterium]|nr:MAG: 50S ribosomal protein L21 [Chlamydiota bacterium]